MPQGSYELPHTCQLQSKLLYFKLLRRMIAARLANLPRGAKEGRLPLCLKGAATTARNLTNVTELVSQVMHQLHLQHLDLHNCCYCET